MSPRPVLVLLRSQSQVFFQDRWVTGLLFLAAFVVADIAMALFAVLGAAVQSGVSWVLPPIDRQEIVDGKHGFCGALTGAAACAAFGPSLQAVPWAVLGSAACVPLVLFFDRGRGSRWGLPAMTAPFCVVSTIAMLLTNAMQPTPAAPVYAPRGPLVDPLVTVLASISQVVLLDNVFSGALILLGLFWAGWSVGLWSLVGAVVGSATGWALQHDAVTLINGLDGYSGVLVALGLGVVFLGTERRRVPLAVVGIALTVPVRILLVAVGLPVYTWPFVLVTWAALLVDRWFLSRTATGDAPPRT